MKWQVDGRDMNAGTKGRSRVDAGGWAAGEQEGQGLSEVEQERFRAWLNQPLIDVFTPQELLQNLRLAPQEMYRELLLAALTDHDLTLDQIAVALSRLPDVNHPDIAFLRQHLKQLCSMGAEVCDRLEEAGLGGAAGSLETESALLAIQEVLEGQYPGDELDALEEVTEDSLELETYSAVPAKREDFSSPSTGKAGIGWDTPSTPDLSHELESVFEAPREHGEPPPPTPTNSRSDMPRTVRHAVPEWMEALPDTGPNPWDGLEEEHDDELTETPREEQEGLSVASEAQHPLLSEDTRAWEAAADRALDDAWPGDEGRTEPVDGSRPSERPLPFVSYSAPEQTPASTPAPPAVHASARPAGEPPEVAAASASASASEPASTLDHDSMDAWAKLAKTDAVPTMPASADVNTRPVAAPPVLEHKPSASQLAGTASLLIEDEAESLEDLSVLEPESIAGEEVPPEHLPIEPVSKSAPESDTSEKAPPVASRLAASTPLAARPSPPSSPVEPEVSPMVSSSVPAVPSRNPSPSAQAVLHFAPAEASRSNPSIELEEDVSATSSAPPPLLVELLQPLDALEEPDMEAWLDFLQGPVFHPDHQQEPGIPAMRQMLQHMLDQQAEIHELRERVATAEARSVRVQRLEGERAQHDVYLQRVDQTLSTVERLADQLFYAEEVPWHSLSEEDLPVRPSLLDSFARLGETLESWRMSYDGLVEKGQQLEQQLADAQELLEDKERLLVRQERQLFQQEERTLEVQRQLERKQQELARLKVLSIYNHVRVQILELKHKIQGALVPKGLLRKKELPPAEILKGFIRDHEQMERALDTIKERLEDDALRSFADDLEYVRRNMGAIRKLQGLPPTLTLTPRSSGAPISPGTAAHSESASPPSAANEITTDAAHSSSSHAPPPATTDLTESVSNSGQNEQDKPDVSESLPATADSPVTPPSVP
ncbi:MAG: hypothetical protein ACKO6N_07005 [Myxococcota bacterium]